MVHRSPNNFTWTTSASEIPCLCVHTNLIIKFSPNYPLDKRQQPCHSKHQACISLHWDMADPPSSQIFSHVRSKPETCREKKTNKFRIGCNMQKYARYWVIWKKFKMFEQTSMNRNFTWPTFISIWFTCSNSLTMNQKIHLFAT